MALADLTKTTVNPRVARILRFVRARHGDSVLDLARMAGAARLSRCHVSRLIKHETGVGFATHLRAARVNHAKHLLQSTDLSVKEIAAAVGYTNTNALDRNFKAVTGLTPTSYRHRVFLAQALDVSPEGLTTYDDDDDKVVYTVVINREEQYAIWPEHRAMPDGWHRGGKTGPKQECLDYISQVWTDMRPLSQRQA
jgi:MbtH protein